MEEYQHPNRKRVPVEALIEAYRAGQSARTIGAAHGVSWQTVIRRLQEAGVAIRTRRDWRGGRQPLPLDDERIRQMVAEGCSCAEIGAEMGVGAECIRRRLVGMGLARLPAKARMTKNVFWRGGRTVDKQGYVLVKAPGHPHAGRSGYVREHRLVMERKLGRLLERHEVVDHIDGNTANNDPENLRLFASNGDHLRVTLKGRRPNWTAEGLVRMRSRRQRSTTLPDANREV